MIDMTRLDQTKRPVRFGDHVDFIGVDIVENGDMLVARPSAKDSLFDPRQLRVSAQRA